MIGLQEDKRIRVREEDREGSADFRGGGPRFASRVQSLEILCGMCGLARIQRKGGQVPEERGCVPEDEEFSIGLVWDWVGVHVSEGVVRGVVDSAPPYVTRLMVWLCGVGWCRICGPCLAGPAPRRAGLANA